VLAYHRWQNGGPHDDVIVVINFANKLHEAYDMPFPRDGEWHVRFNSTWSGYSRDFKDITVPSIMVSGGKGTVVLPPYTAIILSQDS
jgi:1,4-alpha-glucan branching enzyme